MLKLLNIDLTIPPNGLRIAKSVIQDNKNWYNRQLLVNTKEDSREIGFDLVALTGKRHYVSFAKNPEIDLDKTEMSYANVLQTAISLNGINLDIKAASRFYTLYKTNQTEWAIKEIYLQKLQDPDITISGLNEVKDLLKNHKFTTEQLSIFTETIDVFFNKGQSCNFSYLVHSSQLFSQYTDFTFNLLSWEPIT